MPRNIKPDWEAIKAEYIRGGISQQKLADKHGVHRSTLHRHMVNEHWNGLRDSVAKKSGERLVEIVAEAQAEDMARLGEMQMHMVDMLFDKLLEIIKVYPDGAGTRITRETFSMNTVTLDDGTEKKYPLKSAIVNDLESIVRSMVNLCRLVGLDARSKLDRERLNLMQSITDSAMDNEECDSLIDEIREQMAAFDNDML